MLDCNKLQKYCFNIYDNCHYCPVIYKTWIGWNPYKTYQIGQVIPLHGSNWRIVLLKEMGDATELYLKKDWINSK